MILAVCVLESVAAPITYDFYRREVTDDTWADQWNPDTTRGSASTLFQRVYFQWDLDSSDDIVSVTDAEVRISASNNQLTDGQGNPVTVTWTLWRLTETFDETTLTHNNRPAHDDSVSVSHVLPEGMSQGAWQTIDISSLFVNNEDMETFGLLLRSDGASGSTVAYSKELDSWPGPGRGARLTVDYTVIPEPATLVLLGLGGLLLLRRLR